MEDRRMNGTQAKSLSGEDKAGNSPTCSGFDFRKLYGDLSRKLLNTPVEEIFSDVISGAKPKITPDKATRNVSPSTVHSAFPTFGSSPTSPLSLLGNHCEQSATLASPLALYSSYPNPVFSIPNCDSLSSTNVKEERLSLEADGQAIKDYVDNFDDMENIDIQKLVEEFRITLERYGVSQRFAARFIMQDTSQGNLSFLMEKGRNKKWAELSARGRLPYIKMKAWLASKEHQMMTLNMLKYSQEVRKSSPRENFNRRERFSMFQLNILCRMFEENPNPPMNIRTCVAERLGIPLDRVNVWFQNQRARGFPARKNLQLQAMYETGQDSSRVFDMDNEYTKFRDSLLSPVDSPLLMTESASVDVSPPLPSVDSALAMKPGNSPSLLRPTAPSLPTNLQTNDSPLDLSASNGIEDKNKNTSGQGHHISRDPLTPTDVSIHSDAGVSAIKCEITPKVGSAKRKRGYIPQQIIQRKSSADSEPDAVLSPKRLKTENSLPCEMKYNYLLHADDLQTGQETDCKEFDDNPTDICSQDVMVSNSSGSKSNSSACETSLMLNSEGSNQSAEGSKITNADNGAAAGYQDFVKNAESMEVFKMLCASIAIKKDNSSIIDVKEPDLD